MTIVAGKRLVVVDFADLINPRTTTYYAILRETAAQACLNNTVTPINLSISDADPSAGHSGSGATWTAGIAGLYMVCISGGIVATGAGRTELRIRVNSTDKAQAGAVNSATAASHMGLSRLVVLAIGDTVSAVILQNSGGTLNTSTANGNPMMTIHLVAEL